jgi:anaerobic selenocysteine-containing dehydrogenase
VPFEEVVRHPGGKTYDLEPVMVEPARPGAVGRFEVMPDDVRDELEQFRLAAPDHRFTHRIAVRRMRQVMNSLDPAVPETARGGRYNPAYLHPDDLSELGVADGDPVEIVSDYTRIAAIVASDDRIRRGVVSISHCFGGLPHEDDDPRAGTCTNRLIDTRRHRQSINAMPTMSGLPVNIVPASG